MPIFFNFLGGVARPGSGGILTFSDDFNRSDTTALYNSEDGTWQKWNYWGTGGTLSNLGLGLSTTNLIMQGCIVFGNRALINCAGGAGVVLQARCFIVPAMVGRWSQLSGKSQFVQATIINDTSIVGVKIRAGLAVYARQTMNEIVVNQGDGYILQTNYELGTMALYRSMGSGGTNAGDPIFPANGLLIAGGGTMVFALNDVLRVECSVTATTNELSVKRNGTVVGTYSDAAANRCTVGVPGFAFIYQDSNAANQTWDDFSAGQLT